VKELAQDSSQYVRAALASVVMDLAPKIGKQPTITHLLPVFLSLLKDIYPEVRLNIFSNLDQVNQAIGVNLLAQNLLPALEELSDDKHWRVRLAVIEHIPILASQLGPEFFKEKLGDQCMKWLEDQVASIREAATVTLHKIAQEFGPEWTKENLVPQVTTMIQNPHYLYRMTVLVTISMLTMVVDEADRSQLLQSILDCAKDPVPNVKFSVAKNLQRLMTEANMGRETVSDKIKPCLKELSEDEDADVRFFASQALDTCNKLLTV